MKISRFGEKDFRAFVSIPLYAYEEVVTILTQIEMDRGGCWLADDPSAIYEKICSGFSRTVEKDIFDEKLQAFNIDVVKDEFGNKYIVQALTDIERSKFYVYLDKFYQEYYRYISKYFVEKNFSNEIKNDECLQEPQGEQLNENDIFDISAYVSGYIEKLNRKKPQEVKFAHDDRIYGCIRWYIEKMINGNPPCLCRHDKLAAIAFDNAIDEAGYLLKDKCDQDRLHNMILKQAAMLVPKERQIRSREYDLKKCQCEILSHEEYQVKRRGKKA